MKNSVYLSIIVVLLLVIGAMAYKFIIAGSTQKADDGRAAVVLEAGERDFVLKEMRGFVVGLQQISDALSREDMTEVSRIALTLGMGHAHDAPAAILGKLPLPFKTLARDTHRGFDTLAADAQRLRDPKHTLAQLSDVLQKCVACHASYSFRTETTK